MCSTMFKRTTRQLFFDLSCYHCNSTAESFRFMATTAPNHRESNTI
jgi:hypothetical protein